MEQVKKVSPKGNIVERAENVINNLKPNKHGGIALKTNQIRKFLTAVNILANKVAIYKAEHPGATELSEDLTAEMQYLQVKLAYQVGREKKDAKSQFQIGPVEDFVNNAGLISAVKNIGNSIAEFEKFNRYMEALVAYHKFYGGKDL